MKLPYIVEIFKNSTSISLEKLKNKIKNKRYKKKISIKKTIIVLSTIFVFLNCFLWKFKLKICSAEDTNNLQYTKEYISVPFVALENKNLRAEFKAPNKWKKRCDSSWQTLQVFFKQNNLKHLGEIKWGLNEIVNSSRAFNNASALIEKISELRKRRLNPKIQLEGVMLSGIKSYFLQDSSYPSKEDLFDQSYSILKNGALNCDKFQKGESLQSLVNYFPNLKFLVDNSKTIPIDSGKGFSMTKFFSNKGSPFFKKMLEQEFSNGYNTPVDSKKAFEILIKDAHRYLYKNKIIRLNKKAIVFKLKSKKPKCAMKFSIKPLSEENFYTRRFRNYLCGIVSPFNKGFGSDKKRSDKKKFKVEIRIWNKKFHSRNFEIKNMINGNQMNQTQCSSYNKKISDRFLKYNVLKKNIKLDLDVWKFISFPNRPLMQILDYLYLVYNTKSSKDEKVYKMHWSKTMIFNFQTLKKKRFSSYTSKYKFLNRFRKKGNFPSLWEDKKFDHLIRSHVLCFQSKKFQCGKIFHEKQDDMYFLCGELKDEMLKRDRVRWISLNNFLPENFKKDVKNFLNYEVDALQNEKFLIYTKKNAKLTSIYALMKNKFNYFFKGKICNSYSFLNEAKNYTRKQFIDEYPLKVRDLKEKKNNTNFEIFNFTKSLSCGETKDWKTSVSFLNSDKFFKDLRTLNLLGEIHRYGHEIPKSSVESQKFYNKSAELGNLPSQVVLGMYFLKGIGVIKNKKSAFLIFSKTAHEGVSEGFYNTIAMLRHGVGIEKDNLRAFKILKNSKHLLSKERKPFKKYRKVNKSGFFKALLSHIRLSNEICSVSFFIGSFGSSLTSYLSTTLFERAYLVSSVMNLSNLSEKRGSLACKKKLRNIFLQNRQQYLCHEYTENLSDWIFKGFMGIDCVKDHNLCKNIFTHMIHKKKIFHILTNVQNNFLIFFYRLFHIIILSIVWVVNFLRFFFPKM